MISTITMIMMTLPTVVVVVYAQDPTSAPTQRRIVEGETTPPSSSSNGGSEPDTAQITLIITVSAVVVTFFVVLGGILFCTRKKRSYSAAFNVDRISVQDEASNRIPKCCSLFSCCYSKASGYGDPQYLMKSTYEYPAGGNGSKIPSAFSSASSSMHQQTAMMQNNSNYRPTLNNAQGASFSSSSSGAVSVTSSPRMILNPKKSTYEMLLQAVQPTNRPSMPVRSAQTNSYAGVSQKTASMNSSVPAPSQPAFDNMRISLGGQNLTAQFDALGNPSTDTSPAPGLTNYIAQLSPHHYFHENGSTNRAEISTFRWFRKQKPAGTRNAAAATARNGGTVPVVPPGLGYNDGKPLVDSSRPRVLIQPKRAPALKNAPP